MASLRKGLSSTKIGPSFVQLRILSCVCLCTPFMVRPSSHRQRIKLAFLCSPICRIHWNGHIISLCTNDGPGCSSKNMLCLEPQVSGLRCRPGGAPERTERPNGSCNFALPQEFDGFSEDNNHRSRLFQCRTHSTTIFGRALFRDVTLFTFHSRISKSLFVKNFVNASVDILYARNRSKISVSTRTPPYTHSVVPRWC